MTTIERDRNNPGRCNTVGAGPLLTSEELFEEIIMCQDERAEFSDEAAATVASWWHGPAADGVMFSVLSHRLQIGVGVDVLLDAIYNSQRLLDTQHHDGVAQDRLALGMLSTWAINGPGRS